LIDSRATILCPITVTTDGQTFARKCFWDVMVLERARSTAIGCHNGSRWRWPGNPFPRSNLFFRQDRSRGLFYALAHTLTLWAASRSPAVAASRFVCRMADPITAPMSGRPVKNPALARLHDLRPLATMVPATRVTGKTPPWAAILDASSRLRLSSVASPASSPGGNDVR
jgi:hypothetical protein